MHPLGAFALEGFAMRAGDDWVVHSPFERTWRLLGVGAEEPDDLPPGVSHRIVERFDAGEHRCTMVGTLDGRAVCARGFRRLLAHREVLEVFCLPREDRLVRTTYEPLRFGRTRVVVDVGHRLHTDLPLGVPRRLSDPELWTADLLRRRESALHLLGRHRSA